MDVHKFEVENGSLPLNEIVTGVTNEYYHGVLVGISSTGVKELLRSPAHYLHYNAECGRPQKQSHAMRMGSAIHAAILEPDVYEEQYLKAPFFTDRRSKEYRIFAEGHDPNLILIGKEVEHVEGMAESVRSHPIVKRLLAPDTYVTEAVMTTMYRENSVQLKVKADIITEDGKIIDLKKTQDARPRLFNRAIGNYMYNVQAAFYRMVYEKVTGEPPVGVYMLAVEEQPPHGTMLYAISDADMMRGEKLVHHALETYEKYAGLPSWPCYPDEPVIAEIPKFQRELQDDIVEIAYEAF